MSRRVRWHADPNMPLGSSSSPVEQRAALGQTVCSRSACRRPFQAQRSGGIAQRFCTARCRRLADAEFRRVARAAALRRSISGGHRRGCRRSTAYWCVATDAATGRSVTIAIRPPENLARGRRRCAADEESPLTGSCLVGSTRGGGQRVAANVRKRRPISTAESGQAASRHLWRSRGR